jgi:hypothetical protein
MKKLQVLVLIFCVLPTLSCKEKRGCTNPKAKNFCFSCRKDDGSCDFDTVAFSKAIFWISKATSDSLIAHGYTRLFCVYDTASPAPIGSPISNTSSSRLYYTSPPLCDDHNAMSLSWGLKKNGSVNLFYFIQDSSSACQYGFNPSHTFRNWRGMVSLNYGECADVKLTW